MKNTQPFEELRPYLFSIAYRMLGSVMGAEDMVQETYLRYEATDKSKIHAIKPFLSTIITRLCLDQLKSARHQRESYIGPWLPEPLITENLPLKTVAQREQITMAFLVLLETLSPVERAVFLLRDLFEYDYEEIAAIVGKQEANCRQLYSRAKRHIVARRPRFDPSRETQERVLHSFLLAVQEGDLTALDTVLAEDVRVWSDGGGKVVAAQKPIVGREKVKRFIVGITRLTPSDLSLTIAEVNGTLSMMAHVGGKPYSVMNFMVVDGQISEIRSVLNPEKLTHIVIR